MNPARQETVTLHPTQCVRQHLLAAIRRQVLQTSKARFSLVADARVDTLEWSPPRISG
jgi:hypothetical protein